MQDLKEWLTWLRHDVGYDGWRFDFVKGYQGQRVREYVEATQPEVAVGEYWDDCGYEGEHGDQLCANQVSQSDREAPLCLEGANSGVRADKGHAHTTSLLHTS